MLQIIMLLGIFNFNIFSFYKTIILFILYLLLFTIIQLAPIKIVFNNKYNNILYKNNSFIKESFYIDFLQKKIINNFFKKTLIISSQMFNLNFFILLIVKYIYSMFLINQNFFQKNNNLNILPIFIYLYSMFYMSLIILLNFLIIF